MHAALAALLASEPVDVVVQEAEGRRKKLLIADMDSTMIDQECIDELAAEIGIKTHVAAITARSMNGEIAFEPALRERVALLKGLDVGHRPRHRAAHHARRRRRRAGPHHAQARRLDGARLRRLRRFHRADRRAGSAFRRIAPTGFSEATAG